MPERGPAEVVEEALGALNDELSKLISAELFLNQRPVAELSSTFHPGTPGPMTSPAALMQEVLMADTPLAAWFKRESPSRWMKDLMGGTRAAIEQAVTTAIASAVWGLGARQELITWNAPSAWIWMTEADGLVCRICGPNHQQRYPTAEAAGPYPVHPRCRCSLVPAN